MSKSRILYVINLTFQITNASFITTDGYFVSEYIIDQQDIFGYD